MSSLLVFAIVLIGAVFTVLWSGVKTVPQGYNWTVVQFGRFHSLLQPGLNLIVPFVDQVGHKISLMETSLAIPSQRVITKDNASVEVDGIVFYMVLDAVKAAYAVQNLQFAITNLAMTNIRTAIGAMDLDETLSNRERINSELLRVLDLATESWGTKVTRVELKDVQPPADVVASMAKQLAADREARALVLQADGVRRAAILKAEGEKQATVLAAEGRLEAATRDAAARERLAAAEAAATRSVSEAVEAGSPLALNYFIAQRYVEALQQLGGSHNSKLIMVPLEAAGITGSIAGIAELVRQGLASEPSPSPTTQRRPGARPSVPPTFDPGSTGA